MPIPLHTFESRKPDPFTGRYSPWAPERLIPFDWLSCNYEQFLYHPDLIVRDAEPYEYLVGPHEPGIYFLVNQNSIVYVGLSKFIHTRLAQHFDNNIEFSHYWCFGGIPDTFLEEVELFYIHALEPPLNVKYPPLGSPASGYVQAYKSGTLAFAREHC